MLIPVGLQLLASLIPWVVGAGLGGGLGYLFARLLRPAFKKFKYLRRRMMLIPWRSLVVALPFLGFFIPRFFDIGMLSGFMIVGIYVLIFTVPFTMTTLFNQWYPIPLRVRLIALGRILAVGAISVSAAAEMIGGFVGSSVMIQGLRELNHNFFFGVFAIVYAVALLVDILFGVIQFVFFRPDAAITAVQQP